MNKKIILSTILLSSVCVHADVKDTVKKAPAKVEAAKATAKDAYVPEITSNVAAKSDLKVGYVNTMEAMQASEQGKQISVTLEKKRNELTEEIKKQEKLLTQAMNDYKAKESTLNTAARNAEEAKITKMRNDLESTVKTSENDMKLAMQEATEAITMNVEKAAIEIAQAQNLDIVTDIYTGRTIYASPKAMVTDDLVKTMNKKAPAKKAVA